MADRRKKDCQWIIADEQGRIYGDNCDWKAIQTAVLLDLRDEMKKLNTVLLCWKFQSLPDNLNRIDRRLERNGFLLTTPRRRQKNKTTSQRKLA